MKTARVFLGPLSGLALLFVLPLSSCGRQDPAPPFGGAVRSVVMVEVEIAPGLRTHGSGFVLEGKVYTCAHVIRAVKTITVIFSNGKKQSAKLLRQDNETDLAELEIAHPPRSLILRARAPHFFERIWEIGNPNDLRFVTTTGYFLTFNGKENVFLIDTWFGNSGSPIMDNSGQVIGMAHDLIPGTRYCGGGTLQELQNFVHPERPR